MRVYRLERGGIGPCMGRAGSKFLYSQRASKAKQKKTSHIHHQIPGDLYYIKWSELHSKATKEGSYLFGCRSKDSLKAYFNFCLQPYFKQGYKIKGYDVPDNEVLDMGHEVAFPVRYHKLKKIERVKQALKR